MLVGCQPRSRGMDAAEVQIEEVAVGNQALASCATFAQVLQGHLKRWRDPRRTPFSPKSKPRGCSQEPGQSFRKHTGPPGGGGRLRELLRQWFVLALPCAVPTQLEETRPKPWTRLRMTSTGLVRARHVWQEAGLATKGLHL